MSSHNEYIVSLLKEAAGRHYDTYSSQFLSLDHFQDCVHCCYHLIASRYGHEINSRAAVVPALGGSYSEMKPCNIPSRDFAKVLPRFRTSDGIQHRPPYKACLDTLIAERIIHSCESYSNKPGESFTKAYGVHNDFLKLLVRHYQKTNEAVPSLDVRAAICGNMPKSLLTSRLQEARKLYKALGEINGIRLTLPTGWDSGCDEAGHLLFNPELTLEGLINDMTLFKGQSEFCDADGRHFDWFTSCSSIFRTFLHVDGKPYREIVDFPSGMFWTLAIDGYLKGQIPYPEASALVHHCFDRTFYSDISGQPKSKFIKNVFMRVINTDSRRFESYYHSSGQFRKIADNLSVTFPRFWEYIQTIRTYCMKPGKLIHRNYTYIEKDIINKLMEILTRLGHTHLFRVHDAIWGLDSIPEAEHYLHILANNKLLQI